MRIGYTASGWSRSRSADERVAAFAEGPRQPQLTMIAIGGVIGAGLFVGSGVVIGDTGPGAFITYALSAC